MEIDAHCPHCDKKFKYGFKPKCFVCNNILISKNDIKTYGTIILCKSCYGKTSRGQSG